MLIILISVIIFDQDFKFFLTEKIFLPERKKNNFSLFRRQVLMQMIFCKITLNFFFLGLLSRKSESKSYRLNIFTIFNQISMFTNQQGYWIAIPIDWLIDATWLRRG